MNLQTAALQDLVQYLLVNPALTGQGAGEILLNICQRLMNFDKQIR